MIPPDIEMKKSGLPKYVVADKYRDGSPRLIFRRDGRKVTLAGPYGSDAFWTAYAAAKAGKPIEAGPATPRPKRAVQGSLRALCDKYEISAQFKELDGSTQGDYRLVFKSICAEPMEPGSALIFADCPVTTLTRKHLAALRDRKAGAPTAANKRLTYLHRLFNWAVKSGEAQSNPVAGVERVRITSQGFHSWTPDEVHKFFAHHPLGSRAHLAMSLIVYAGFRRSDVCTFAKNHIEDGWIKKPQYKNRKRLPKDIEIPILPKLAEAMEACPSKGRTILDKEAKGGGPYSIKAFGNRFKKWCRAAGLPHCTAHGGRKAAAAIAAENGATEAQLMAIFGWEDAKEVVTYIRKMRRRQMAGEAMGLLVPKEIENKNVPPPKGVQKRGTKATGKAS